MKKCKECIHYHRCYIYTNGSDAFPQSIRHYFDAVTTRDVCINDGKDSYLYDHERLSK